MMQLHTQHWHVAVIYPGYQDGYEDQPFEDIDSALDYANQTRDTFWEDGHQVTEVDRPDDDAAGVVQRYQATEQEEEAMTVAIVEVRPCYQEGCLPGQPPDFLPVDVADGGPPLDESCRTRVLDVGGPKRPGRIATRSLRSIAVPQG